MATTKFNTHIIDFGLGKIYGEDSENLKTARGTPYYVAPEVISGKSSYGPECDLWSLGVLTYWLLNLEHQLPFTGKDLSELLKQIREMKFYFYQEEFVNISEEAKDFISKLLVGTDDRLTVSQACQQ